MVIKSRPVILCGVVTCLIGIFSPSILAKANCGIEFQVYANGTKERLSGSQVFVIENSKNKGFKAKRKKKRLYVRNLLSGSYDIYISKKGYQRSALTLELECKGIGISNFVDLAIPMWPGKSAETIYLKKSDKSTGGFEVDEGRISTVDIRKDASHTSKRVRSGIINGKALRLVKPDYPEPARAVRASGSVQVSVTINEAGSSGSDWLSRPRSGA